MEEALDATLVHLRVGLEIDSILEGFLPAFLFVREED